MILLVCVEKNGMLFLSHTMVRTGGAWGQLPGTRRMCLLRLNVSECDAGPLLLKALRHKGCPAICQRLNSQSPAHRDVRSGPESAE